MNVQFDTAPCCNKGLHQVKTPLCSSQQNCHSVPGHRFSLACQYCTATRLCWCCRRWLQSPSCLSQKWQNSSSTTPALLWTLPTSLKEWKGGCVGDIKLNKQVQLNIHAEQCVRYLEHLFITPLQNTFFLSLHSCGLIHVVHPHLIADVSESFEHLSQLIWGVVFQSLRDEQFISRLVAF